MDAKYLILKSLRREMNKNQRKKIKEALKMKSCRYCRSKENLTIDHKVPITQGGKDDISNLQCLCKRCNGIKSGLSHNQVLHYWRWFETVQRERESNGKKPYTFKSKLINKYMTFTDIPQSSDEFPPNMGHTYKVEDPYKTEETLQEGKESYNDEDYDTRSDNQSNNHD